MGNRAKKSEIRILLQSGDFDSLINRLWPAKNLSRILQSLVYDPDEEIMWRAIRAVGLITGIAAEKDIDKVRDLIRRLLWLMNDESGGLGWHSPEMIGEILVNVPQLIDEYGQLLMAFFKEEPFERGSHLAVYRVASIDPKPFVAKVNELTESLGQPDTYIRAYTILALGEIDPVQVKKVENKFNTATEKIRIFNFRTGQLETTDLKQIVRKVLDGNKTSIDTA